MSTRVAITSGLALTLAIGAIVTMLALGIFTTPRVAAAITAATVTATPNVPGAAARYVVTFSISEDLTIGDVINLEFENEYQVPATIDRSTILIDAPGEVTNTTRYTANPSDVTISLVGSPPNQQKISLTIPDMNPSDDHTEGIGPSDDASGVVKVTFAQRAGIKNPKESAKRTVKISTSATADEDPVTVKEFFPRVITLSAADGGRGKQLTVTGLGYTTGTATVWLDNNEDGMLNAGEIELAEAPISDNSFIATVTVANPPFTAGKGRPGDMNSNAINAKDGRGNTIVPNDSEREYGNSEATGCIANGGRISCLSRFDLRGSITVTPSSAAVGDTVQISIKDFTPGRSFDMGRIDIGGVTVDDIKGSSTTNVQGEATFSAVVPNGVATGSQSLNISRMCCGADANDPHSVRRFIMVIQSAIVTLTPSGSLVPNQTVTVIGRGFTTGGGATINGREDESQVSISGSTDGLTGTSNKINEGKVINIDNGGNWAASIVIPINSTTTTPGSHVLKVQDSMGREGTVNFTIAERILTLTPAASRLGTTVRLTGAGFPADNTKSGSEPTPSVGIEYDVVGTARTVANLTPDSSGNISGSFVVPLNAGIPSTNSVRAEYGANGTTVTTSATHQVPRAILTVEPDRGPPGTTVTISGVGFKTFASVAELTLGDIDVRPAPVPATDNVGSFSTLVLVPQLNTGTQSLTAKIGDTTASATFEVLESGAVTPTPTAGAPPADVFAPIGDALVRAFVWNKGTKSWDLYDPRPAFAAISVDMVAPGNIVQILVNNDAQFQGETLTPDWNVLTLQ